MWQALTVWLRRAQTIIADSAPALNAMNVFPVSDSDTGTNVELTLSGIAAALPVQDVATVDDDSHAETRIDSEQLDALVSAAILSAHGNCGAILAEMFTTVCRTFGHDHAQLATRSGGSLVGLLLRTMSAAANRAVARPVAGTILTVAEEAAEAAESAALSSPHDALAVAAAAQSAARAALARTPEQLEVLARAGVVDAGGQAFVLLLDVLVEVLGGRRAEPLAVPTDRRPPPFAPAVGRTSIEYEVMYAVTGAPAAGLDNLRGQLSDLGNSVVIVGDRTVAQVHVHAADAGSTIEAALGLGTLSRIRVNALDSRLGADARLVVAAVAGEGIADAVRSMGGVAVGGTRAEDVLEQLTAIVDHAGGDVVLLPNGMVSVDTATQLANHVPTGRRVAIIPTTAQVQGLAALAVHEPSSDFNSTVVAMSTAAAHARHAGVTIAEQPAMTTAGHCQPGDVLGLVEGDVVEIGDSVLEIGWRVVKRLMAAGGELLTLITGTGAEQAVALELAGRARQARGGLEVEIFDGGQRHDLLLIGLE